MRRKADNWTHRLRHSETKSPTRITPGHFGIKLAQQAQKRRIWGVFSAQGELFRARTHIWPHRANKFAHGTQPRGSLKPMTPLQPLMQASMKPPSPLLAHEQQPLKPTTPLRPKNALKTPTSHPQRRRRFQPHTDTSEQRRSRFQTTGPPSLQHPHAAPVGSDDTSARQISHVIYRGHFSRHPKNAAIPTMQIQCLNEPERNYVRSC